MPFDPYANGYSDTWKYVGHPRYANVDEYTADTPKGYTPRRNRATLSVVQVKTNGETDPWDPQ